MAPRTETEAVNRVLDRMLLQVWYDVRAMIRQRPRFPIDVCSRPLMRRSLHATLSVGLLLLLALTLAALNPLACVVHCLPRASVALPSPSFAFVCHLPAGTTPAPADLQLPTTMLSSSPLNAPQAVYPCILMPLLLVAILGATRIRWSVTFWTGDSVDSRPLVPPPQAAA